MAKCVLCVKRGIFLAFVFCLFSGFIISQASAEIHATQEATGTYYHVDGQTSRSFYPSNRATFLYEGSVDFKDQYKDSEFSLFGNINYRSTNDKLVDRKDNSIERMYFGLKGAAQEYLAGDFYSNFSEYSLGNALKGGRIVLGDDKSFRFTILGGIDTSKWEDLWEKGQEDSNAKRYVGGMRLESKFFENKLNLNFNYGYAHDDDSSIPVTGTPTNVNVFSFDSKYKLNEYLGFYGEIAQSFTDENTRLSTVTTKGDKAGKFGFDLNLKDYTLNTQYSRVGAHFNTTGGFSSKDLETWNLDGMWFLPAKVKFKHYLRMDSDNLEKLKSTTTRQLNPGGKFAFTLPWDISANMGADFRKRFSTDKGTNEKTLTYTTSFGKDFGIVYSTLGYNRVVVSNKISPAQERTSDVYSLGLDGSFKIKEVKLSWSTSEDIERVAYKEAHKADFTASTSLGLKANFPSTLALQAKTSYTDSDYYLHSTDSKNRKYYFSVSRNIMRSLLKDDLAFDVTYERNCYRYYGGDNNYAETILKGKLNYKF